MWERNSLASFLDATTEITSPLCKIKSPPGIDEENILLTLHTRQVSKAKVITKINRINFKDVIAKLDLGSVIYPRYITSEAIIAYVRARRASLDSNIETLYHMFDHLEE